MKLLSSVNVETSENVDINLSPLIDMVFLLLIFFMVTTVFVEETGIEVEKPVAATARQLEKESIILTVTADGDIYYGDRQIVLNNVQGLVTRLTDNRTRPVIIMADKKSHTGTAVQIIDQCKRAGIENVSIATETGEVN